MSSPWRPTAALATATTLGTACLALAVALRRADLVAVAAPLLVAVIRALRPADGGDPAGATVTLTVPARAVWEDESVTARLEVRVDRPVDLARVAVVHGPGVRVEPPGALCCLLPRPGRPAHGEVRLRALHWGRTLVGPATAVLTAGHGLLRRGELASRTGALTTVPLRAVFEATDVVPRASGMVGAHRSRLAGAGTDLLAVRPFVAGDRLRRITWPVSTRTGRLHVTTTTDDRDTDVQLLVDSTAALGGAPDGETSLDVAVRAAASVAEHYLRRGDRVGLIDLGAALRPVRVAAGRRHLLLVLDVLLGATVRRPDHARIARLLSAVPPRALVIVFSTLVDEQVARHVAAAARAGHAVLVVDTLPADAAPPAGSEWTPLAWQLALLGRDTVRRRLAEVGVPVVPWRGARSLDEVLLRLARAAAVPRRAR